MHTIKSWKEFRNKGMGIITRPGMMPYFVINDTNLYTTMPATEKPSKTASTTSKKRWITYFILFFILVSVGSGIYIYAFSAPSLQEVLAEEFSVSPTEALFVNVPPGSLRLPGTIITAGDILLDGIEADDPRLDYGTAHSFSKAFDGFVYGSSFSGKNKLWRILTDSKSGWQFKVQVNQGQVIQINGIVDRIKESPLFASIQAGTKMLIVAKAFKGDISIIASTNKSMDGQLAVEFGSLQAVADSLSTTISIAENDSITWRFQDVYAFLAIDPTTLPGILDGATPAGTEASLASVNQSETDPDSLAQFLLEFDPAVLPNLDITLREAGPGVGPAIMKKTIDGDSTARVRGTEFLIALPKSYRVKSDAPQSSLNQGSATERAWSLLQLLDEPSPNRTSSLESALADNNRSIRYLAARSIGDLGADASGLSEALDAASRDEDKAVQDAARTSMIKVSAQQGRDLAAARIAGRSDRRRRRKSTG